MIEQLLRAENALALGLLDQAEKLYEQTLAHDPANAIALVGLSRVALERGDERASLGFARRAVSIASSRKPAVQRQHARSIEKYEDSGSPSRARRASAIPRSNSPQAH